MTDRNKESLSALMDGEADELEMRRVLNQLEKDDELAASWKSYHLMGSLMRDESFDSIDLTLGINKALDGEDTINQGPVTSTPIQSHESGDLKTSRAAWYKPLTSVAVAASVTFAVLIGVQSIEPNNGLGLADAQVLPVLQSKQGELTASNLSLEEQQQLEAAQQQLQEYVLQNSADPSIEKKEGVLPFARVVEFQSQGK
jgi:sigma-E factor negative regulatory protein RseA